MITRQIFAEPGNTVQQIGGICPPGWIEMEGQRPDGDYRATEAGTWEIYAPVPDSVSARQARLAMLNDGILDQIPGAIADITDAVKRQKAEIEWEYATIIERNAEWVSELGQSLGLSEAQIDDLFRLADTL